MDNNLTSVLKDGGSRLPTTGVRIKNMLNPAEADSYASINRQPLLRKGSQGYSQGALVWGRRDRMGT